MPEIRLLPRHLVNKIAAGEVIERPASVVKELVENSLDAGATEIDVTVEEGGRRLIRVRDNGAGMGAEDLALAFASHTTSKIADEDDLFNICTMGFRGEALASIASVSHAHILSRPRGGAEDTGHEMRVSGDEAEPVQPAAAPEGTTVTIRDLFFNTPARRKFMRTVNTEFGHVVERLARLALPHRQVAFTLTHNGRTTHRLPSAESLRQRAGDFLGAALAETFIEFASDEGSVRISGLIAPPAAARASARWQYFFVNRRHVRDRLLAHALREAFRGLLEQGRSPVALVFLEIEPAAVDVNVHPAKVEVRFRQGQLIHSQLLGVLRETLNKADLAPRVAIDAGAGDEPPEPDDDRRRSLKQALAEFFKSTPPPQRRLEYPAPPARAESRGTSFPPAAPVPEPPEPTSPAAEAPAPRVAAIQIHNSYIVTATEEGLAIIDQHALHERILFEELTRRLAEGSLLSQRLLIPESVELGEAEKAALADRAELLERLGIEVGEFGPGSVAIHRFPSLLAERKVPAVAFLRDLLDVLAESASADGAELLERVLATMACKAAVKAGDPLTAEEIEALLGGRVAAERSSSCPHGRPTVLKLSLAELDKQFKRT